MAAFRPIVFHDKFTLRGYFGWKCLSETPHVQHLELVQGTFRRQLLLFFEAGDALVHSTLQEKKSLLESASELRIYRYPAPDNPAAPISWNGIELHPAVSSDRMFNTNTFVQDLALSEDELWNGFNTLTKRVCKQAAKDGVEARITENPGPEIIEHFTGHYKKMAQERGLRLPSRPSLDKMARDGVLLSVASWDQNGKSNTTLLIYKCEPYAIYLHGASAPEAKSQLGQFLQWETMKYLRAKGFRWYDLGGVPSIDEENGIYRFKKALGGKLVGPSIEYVFRKKLFRAARWIKERLHL